MTRKNKASPTPPPAGSDPPGAGQPPEPPLAQQPDQLPDQPPAATAAAPDTAAAPTPAPDTAAASTPAPEPAAAPSPCRDNPGKFALVVDDEPANRDFLVRLLEQAQLEVKGAVDAADALNKLEGVTCARIIAIDNLLPDMNGVELLALLRKRYPEARIVMATMLDDRALMAKAFENGCDVFLVKPHGFMELFRRVQLLESGEDGLQKLVIDQYGPRPYRG